MTSYTLKDKHTLSIQELNITKPDSELSYNAYKKKHVLNIRTICTSNMLLGFFRWREIDSDFSKIVATSEICFFLFFFFINLCLYSDTLF